MRAPIEWLWFCIDADGRRHISFGLERVNECQVAYVPSKRVDFKAPVAPAPNRYKTEVRGHIEGKTATILNDWAI